MKTIIYKNYEKIDIYQQPLNNYNKIDEIIKSFILSLQIPVGSFILDKSIGSNFIYKLKQLAPKNFSNNVLYVIKEIALNFPLINIKNVECSFDKNISSLNLSLTLTVNNIIFLIYLEVNI